MNIKRYLILTTLLLMAGCATAPPKEVKTVFYPDPPELPRVQYLTFFTGEKDISPKKTAFSKFITGAAESRQRLDKPYGAAIWGGKLYVCDTNQGIVVFDLEKKTYGGLQGAQGMGKLIQPINIRVDSEGVKYVTDPVRGQVVVFDKNDFYVAAFGDPQAWKPVDAVPYGDELYVADIKNSAIVVLDKKSGEVARKFGNTGGEEQRVYKPTNLAFDKEGHLYVSDISRFQIAKFDRDGHALGAVGEIGVEHGSFARPKGITIDREGRLYAVDSAFANVQLFNRDGVLLMFFGGGGDGPGGMNLPAQVIVDYDHIKYFQQYVDPKFEPENIVIVVNQFGDHMINVYALGKEKGKRYLTDAELQELVKAKQEKEAKEKAEKEKAAEKKDEPDQEKK